MRAFWLVCRDETISFVPCKRDERRELYTGWLVAAVIKSVGCVGKPIPICLLTSVCTPRVDVGCPGKVVWPTIDVRCLEFNEGCPNNCPGAVLEADMCDPVVEWAWPATDTC